MSKKPVRRKQPIKGNDPKKPPPITKEQEELLRTAALSTIMAHSNPRGIAEADRFRLNLIQQYILRKFKELPKDDQFLMAAALLATFNIGRQASVKEASE